MSAIVIGLDGGGSKTRVIVADDQGRTVTSVEGAGSAVRPDGIERSADTIAATISPTSPGGMRSMMNVGKMASAAGNWRPP